MFLFFRRPLVRLMNIITMLYPPEGLCASIIPKVVQLFFTHVLFGLGNVYWTFNLQTVFCLFENLKMFYLMGRMGRVGRVGRLGRVGRDIKSVL